MSLSTALAKQPNIVFFLVDDLGWTDLGCYGSTFHESPHIDALAEEGMKFTQSYTPSGVCSPTRSSIITGQNPARHGCTQFGKPIRGQLRSFGQDLKEAGYATFFTGKWHIKPLSPKDAEFSIHHEVTKKEMGRPEDPKATRFITKNTVSFIQSQSAAKPFLAYVNYHAVHAQAKESVDLVAEFEEKLRTDPPRPGKATGGTHDKGWSWKQKQTQDVPEYAAMLKAVDESVAEILDAVQERGFEENTLVIFASDNGGLSTRYDLTSNLPLRVGKGWLYEGGVRVPTIIKWPGIIEPGTTSRIPIISMDYYPTMLEAAGLPLRPEDHVDGLSLYSYLKAGEVPKRDTLYWHYPHYHGAGNAPSGAILHQGYKLVTYFDRDVTELFHISEDLSESEDLSKTMPEKVADLSAMLTQWQSTIPEINFGEEEIAKREAKRGGNKSN
ncbi:MAG: sulfatase [Verrucomicrobiota bacterium]